MPLPSLQPRSRGLFSKVAVLFVTFAGLVACAGTEGDLDPEDELDGEEDGYDVATESDELRTSGAGPCAGKPIDRAVQCAVRKGARVLSFYRSPADQERARRQAGCRNRCTGMAGCKRPAADCNASPHTRCIAVDLINDGRPVSRAALRECGLAKTSLPHKNHYDLVR